jgi:hypothetical protein
MMMATNEPVTCDSDVYNHTFYGILNKQGQFWTPLPFHDEDAARAHLSKWAKGDCASMLDTHKIVPVRVQLTALVGTDVGNSADEPQPVEAS